MTKALRPRARLSIVILAWLACSHAPVAHAQPTYGYDLSWNDCINLPGAAANMDYACDGSRDGNPFKLVITFVPPNDLPKFLGAEVRMVVRTSNLGQLPDWWRLGEGECRPGVITFPSSRAGIGTGTTGSCIDPWATIGSGGYQWSSEADINNQYPGFGILRLAVARETSIPLQAGQRYLIPPILIDPVVPEGSPISVPPPACAGCELAACIAVQVVDLFQEAGTAPEVTHLEYRPIERLHVTWQGGAIGGNGCPVEVPVRRATWGAIKAIYR